MTFQHSKTIHNFFGNNIISFELCWLAQRYFSFKHIIISYFQCLICDAIKNGVLLSHFPNIQTAIITCSTPLFMGLAEKYNKKKYHKTIFVRFKSDYSSKLEKCFLIIYKWNLLHIVLSFFASAMVLF